MKDMHELQVTQSILETVLASARQNNVEKVVRIHLTVGALHDLRREWVQRYFDYLSRDSPAEGAEIVIHRVRAGFRCERCDCLFEVDLEDVDRIRCSFCRAEQVHLEQGQEFFVRDMEVV
jgi:hydrogenase nickel incorporation protein HypA/HybF